MPWERTPIDRQRISSAKVDIKYQRTSVLSPLGSHRQKNKLLLLLFSLNISRSWWACVSKRKESIAPYYIHFCSKLPHLSLLLLALLVAESNHNLLFPPHSLFGTKSKWLSCENEQKKCKINLDARELSVCTDTKINTFAFISSYFLTI